MVSDEDAVADSEVTLAAEDEETLLVAEESVDEVVDKEDEAAPPAGGNLSSAPFASSIIQEEKDSQFTSQGKIVNIQIYIFRVLLDIPTILICDLQRMFSITQASSGKEDSLELSISRGETWEEFRFTRIDRYGVYTLFH